MGETVTADLIRPPAWHQRAACADPELRLAFWEAERELEKKGRSDMAVLQIAQRICGNCTVRSRCDEEWRADEGSESSKLRNGIRAGLTPDEREKKAKGAA